MVRPSHFAYNPQTAVNNVFQTEDDESQAAAKLAREEFEGFADALKASGVNVIIVDDAGKEDTPDSIFPNNWISMHKDGVVALYPMFAPNRRKERRPEVLQALREKYVVNNIVDFTHYEEQNKFLEGTGSLVIDRLRKLAFACISERTNMQVLQDYERTMGTKVIPFHGVDADGQAIYHTNVMMCLGMRYVVICMDSVHNAVERNMLFEVFEASKREVIEITQAQMQEFAGNMLQVLTDKDEPLLVMSTRAYNSLTPEQIAQLEKYNPIMHYPLDTIEKYGGGSARCMLAEIFLPLKKR